MILSDLHIHSNFSDGKLSIPELIDFYGTRGFGCIAITDHICEDRTFFGLAANCLSYTLTPSTFPQYLETIRAEAERAWWTYRMLVIPGYELSKNSWSNHRSAHILGLGVNEWVSADGDVVELARAIRSHGAVSIAAHPVSTQKLEKQTYHLWNRRDELAEEFDAWEVASGPSLFKEVQTSGLSMVASSDLHKPRQIRSWKTLLDCELHPEAVLHAIRKQHLRFRFFDDSIRPCAPPPRRIISIGRNANL